MQFDFSGLYFGRDKNKKKNSRHYLVYDGRRISTRVSLRQNRRIRNVETLKCKAVAISLKRRNYSTYIVDLFDTKVTFLIYCCQ